MTRIPVRHVDFDVTASTIEGLQKQAKAIICDLFDDPDFDEWSNFQIALEPDTTSRQTDGTKRVVSWVGHVHGSR